MSGRAGPSGAGGAYPYRLFEVAGLEIEYMIVDVETGDVRPLAGQVLSLASGAPEPPTEVPRGVLSWSNDLAMHLLEMKTTEPVRTLPGVAAAFEAEVRAANGMLRGLGARLLPGGAHCRMNPAREFQMWPYEHGDVYRMFDRLFDCRRHGWANLQSAQLNLPFGNDEEFGRLHAAVRLVLPLLPALAASSPFLDGRYTGWMDARLREYAANSVRVPSFTGLMIPERVFTRASYEGELLAGIYRDLAPLDPEGVLKYEWINSRGAIARFDRGAIEIRVVDTQETPRADLAVAAATMALTRSVVEERWLGYEAQRAWPEEELAAVLWETARFGEQAMLTDARFLRAFGHRGSRVSAGDVWRHLIGATLFSDPAYEDEWGEPLEVILTDGTLARRMVRAVGESPTVEDLRALESELSACLEEGRVFVPD